MTQSTPAGWYPDGQGGQRWWDGTKWTEHTLPAEASSTSDRPAASEPPAQPGPSDVTQVRPQGDAGSGSAEPEPPAGDRPAAPDAGQPPAAMPTQVAGSGGPAQPGYPGTPQHDAPQPGYAQGGYPGQAGTPGGPGQPGQPAWQGQQYGGSGGGKGKLIGIIAGAVVLLVVVAVVLFLVLGGGGPKDVAQEYFDKSQDQNCDVVDLVGEDLKELVGTKKECEDDKEEFFGFEEGACDDADFELKDEEVDGDEASVKFEVSGTEECEGGDSEGTILLTKEDGDWKITGFE